MLYIKDGEIKDDSEIVIIKNGFQIFNPKQKDILESGWEIYIKPEPTLDEIKQAKIQEITDYDMSTNVNIFYLDDEPLWLDKDTRVGLMNSTNIQKAVGQKSSTLWFGYKSYTLDCDVIIQLLGVIELYALQCYNITAQHKATVELLETKEEVEKYDYTTGYPEKLRLDSNGITNLKLN